MNVSKDTPTRNYTTNIRRKEVTSGRREIDKIR